jgi:hypothetical protein
VSYFGWCHTLVGAHLYMIKLLRENKNPKMARDSVALVGAHVDNVGILLESPGVILWLGMIIMSLSIISMVIFACGDDKSRKRRPGIGGVAGGGCGGGGGDGGGGGGCGGGSGGGC